MTGYLSNVATQNQNTDMNVQKCASIYLQIIVTTALYANLRDTLESKIKTMLLAVVSFFLAVDPSVSGETVRYFHNPKVIQVSRRLKVRFS